MREAVVRTTRMRHGALALLGLLLAAPIARPCLAQDPQGAWTVPTTSPWALGQAQSGRVAFTENDATTGTLFDAGGGVAGPARTVGLFARMVESTDDSLFVIVAGGPTLRKYTRAGTLVRSVTLGGFADIPRRILPLDDGRVLLAFTNSNPARVLKIFDRNCVAVDSIPTVYFDGATGTVVGLARAPGGDVVTCVETVMGNFFLTRYGADGTVRWNVPIVAGGSIATDSRGAVYVCHGANATSLDVYGETGVPAASWTGPPGDPLVRVSDVVTSADGQLLFVLTNASSGPVRVFTSLPVPAARRTWGEVKTGRR